MYLPQGIYKNSVNGTVFKPTCGVLLIYPTGFISDLPLEVGSNYITVITDTLASKFPGLV
jgi:hypothetical protein